MEPSLRHLEKRSRRQRRWLILLALWVLAWTTLALEGLISYTNFFSVALTYMGFALVLSIPALLFFGIAALVGRALGEIRPLRPWKYWITFAPPLALALIPLVTSLLDRLAPERRFEDLTDMALPAGARIAGYEHPFQGIDGSVHFRITGTPAAKEAIEQHMAPKLGMREGVWIHCETDKSGALVVTYLWI